MLALRLAAGQSVEQVAELYRARVARIRRRERSILLRALVSGLQEAAALPRAHRLLRLAGIATYTLACQVRDGSRRATAFAEHCWARQRDPGLVIAEMAQRLLTRLEGLPDHLPPARRHPPRRRPGGGLAGPPALDREVMAYARFLRDATLVDTGSQLRYERRQIEDAPPDDRRAIVRRFQDKVDAYVPHPGRAPCDARGLLMPMLPAFLVDPPREGFDTPEPESG
jgi:hypothetical protein